MEPSFTERTQLSQSRATGESPLLSASEAPGNLALKASSSGELIESAPVRHRLFHFIPPTDSGAREPKLEVISRYPETKFGQAQLLFVHGSGFGAWYWDQNLLPYLASHGLEAHCFSLRGCGLSQGRDQLRSSSTREHVSDIERLIKELKLENPVIIGQSIGGAFVQKYLESHFACGAVLIASVPPFGSLVSTLRFFIRHPGAALKAFLNRSLAPLAESPELAQDSLFSPNIDPGEFNRWFLKIGDGPFRAYLESLSPWVVDHKRITTPVLVLGGENDRIFSVSEIRRTAQAYGTQAKIISGAGHEMIAEESWKKVADEILNFLNRKGLYRNDLAGHESQPLGLVNS